MCEPASQSYELQFASLFLQATAFFLFIYLFIYLFFGVFNLTLTFSSVNGALGRRTQVFDFLLCVKFRASSFRRLLKVSL